MSCWNCQAEPGPTPFCDSCGALQPVPPKADAFAILGLPKTFFVERKEIEERHKELSRKLHPDRFAQKDPKERRFSLEWTTALNDAVKALKDPASRAAYLLREQGLDVEKESGDEAMGRLPTEFLEVVLEDREALAEAKAANDLERVRALSKDVETRAGHELAEVEAAMTLWEKTGDKVVLEKAATSLAVLKYYARFQEEVEAIEQQALQ
ncbi:MAG: Fe-S protein assembly co-chaperone HscB [Myxococcales bacterium]